MLGLSLKDSPAGFDQTKVAGYYDEVDEDELDSEVFVEDEKL